uniref:MOM1 alpha-helical domain-containing protein n=1 Tax=Arundo donax TaxID=35708 RepID=A0A0A9CMA0_ARUDO
MGSTSGGSSRGGAGPNVRSSSNQRKRIDARSYIALFKPSSKAEVAGTVGKSEKLSSIPAKTKKNMEKTTSGPAEGTNEARRKRRKTDAHNTARSEGVENLSTPKCLHVKLKCELSKLIKVLELPDNVRILAEQFLEYLLKNHLVVQQPRCMLHAFHIALCWRAASLLKYKLDRSGSLSLAASCLNYEYNEELTELFYEKFGTLKEKVLPMAGERSNKVENNKFSSQKSSSTNLRNDHMFPDQAMDLHGNLSNGAPQGSSSGAEQMVLDGQEVSAPEADREWHLSSEELPNMIVKKKIDLLNNIFSLREKHIHEKQQLEVLELQTQRENQVIKLKEVCSLVLQHIRTSGIDEDTRNDQIKLMIQWFTMLVYAFLEHMRLQLDKFEALQSTTWLKERLMKEKLLQEVTSGQLDQSLDLCIAQTDSNFVIEEFIHFKKQNGDYRADVILSSGCDQLLDDRLIMGNKLVQNIVPSVAISAQEVINASAKAIVGCGGAATSKSVNLPENNINTSSDGIGIQGDCCSSAFPASHDSINQESSTGEARSIERAKEADPVCLESPISACPQGLATLSVSRDVGTEANLPNMYAQQTVGTSQHPPAEVEPTDTLHVMAALDLQPEMQTSALDASPQRMCPDDSSQLNVEPDPPTGLLQEGTTSYHLGGANMGVKDKSVGTVTAVADTCQTGHQPATTPDLSQGGGSYHHLVEARMGVDVNNNGTVCADQAHSSPAMLPFSSEVETCANLSTMSSQQSSDAPSMLPPAGSDSMGMLGAQAEWDMHPDMRPSTSLLDIPLQRMFPDERNQTGCRPDRATDPSEKRETDCPTCTTHNVATLPLSGEAESDNGQTNMPAQQSTSSNAQQSLATWQHPAEEAESTDIPGMVPADDLQPSPPMLDQTAEAARAGMLDVAAAQNLQHEIQRSTTTQIVPLERIDLSNVTVMRSTTVLQSVEPSWYPHTEPAGTLGMVAAPDVLPEMQPSSSVQDQPAEAEGAGTSRTIAAEDLRPEMQSSTTVQHILPERIHLDQRSQISHQPNTTSGPEQLTQLFAVASADFNHLTCSSEPLKNELERLKYCTDFLSKKHEQKVCTFTSMCFASIYCLF